MVMAKSGVVSQGSDWGSVLKAAQRACWWLGCGVWEKERSQGGLFPADGRG